MISTLIVKDLLQHAKAVAIFTLSAILIPTMTSLLMQDSDEGIKATYLGIVFGYTVMGAPALFSFRLIGHEKMRGTFKFLSILPIPGKTLIVVKAMTAALFCLPVINIALLIMPEIIFQSGGPSCIYDFQTVVWINITAIFFTAIDSALFAILESKTASQIIYAGHTLLVLGVLTGLNWLPESYAHDKLLHQMTSIGINYWGSLLVILVSILMVDISGRIFASKDWSELESD